MEEKSTTTRRPVRAAVPSIAPRLTSVRSWAFAIGDGALGDGNHLRAYGLVVVDGEEVTPAIVARLHAANVIVLAYLSVGTIEQPRSWYAKASPFKLDLWQDWGEWYADVSAGGFRNLIANDVAPSMLAKGVDGLFLDNTDMVLTHPAQAEGMVALVSSLRTLVKARGGVLFAQNGDEWVDRISSLLDGWNREDVSTVYDFDRERYLKASASDTQAALATMARLRSQGLSVTATDYTAAADATGTSEAVQNACSVGALPWVADIGLTRFPAAPYQCA